MALRSLNRRATSRLSRRELIATRRTCLRRASTPKVSAVAATASAADGRNRASGLGSLTFLDYVVPFTAPLAAAVATGAYTGALGAGLAWPLRAALVGAGPLLVHLLLPGLDWLLGPSRALADRQAQAQQAEQALKAPPADDFLSRLLPCLAAATHLLVLFLAYGTLAAAEAPAVPQAPPPAEPQQLLLLPLLVTSLALSAGMAQAASHELLHSRHPVHQAVAWLHLTTHWWYPYFRAHHQHHLTVCTPVDYASAPRGLSLAVYVRRYLRGSYVEAWQLAAAECKRAGKPVFSIHNSCLVALAAQAALAAGLALALGPAMALLHAAVCATFLTYMAVLDYVLHYGLQRPPLAAATAGGGGGGSATANAGAEAAAGSAGAAAGTGEAAQPVATAPVPAVPVPAPGASGPVRYAPVTPFNSWSSLYPFENALFFNVLIHADHHMAASRSYAWLVPTPSTPTFPGPINALGLAAFVPPLWRATMDERADRANRANLQHLAALGAPVAAEAVEAGPGKPAAASRAA
ncbi:hypothetical protein HXX76_004871 [Chlamydomonas incerta]|uniref:Fatty acid desaturase domain-containing protein n=1 Tax=Chlamydomonas incerta TaxID=51695 RepID=A0A835TAI0_CHLIN|nr:hypothetical protein HXX76_004871 [Chlamydomonas incerta]|eukprot:KAG2439518.1 hypothetical protein HXX76_004871 [Chlamydomonas incerta]